MLAESSFLLDLQTVVGQMYEQVLTVHVIFLACSSQVALSEKMDVELVGLVLNVDDNPHPDVKLALFEEQGLFDVLLDHPLRIGRLLVEELQNLSNFAEKLDSFALVESSRFEDPLVISAMFVRDLLVTAHPLSDVQI